MATILIIDDQPEILRVLRRVLELHGHVVAEASDGRTALRHFAGRPADVVITDIYMPEMNGIEFIMRVKEAFPEARIVAMSGGGGLAKEDVLGAAQRLGADAILQKPFTVEQVKETVEGVLGKP